VIQYFGMPFLFRKYSRLLPWLLAGALGVLSPAAHAAKPSPFWLAQIESNYRDEATRLETRFTGTGSVVKIGDEFFILTAGHVSQGTGLSVTIQGKTIPLVPGERLGDNRSDLELLKIDTKALAATSFGELLPVAIWTKEIQAFVMPIAANHTSEGKRLKKKYDAANPKTLRVSEFAQVPIPGCVDPKVAKKLEGWKYKKPLAGWATGGSFLATTGSLVKSAGGDDLIGDVKIAPCMSGAPLLARDMVGVISGEPYVGFDEKIRVGGGGTLQVLTGVAKSLLRDFDHSHFSSAIQIADLVKRYQKGERGRVDKTQWRMRYALTYRDFGDGTQEILPSAQPAGNGRSQSSGNGSGTDGGNGSGTDGSGKSATGLLGPGSGSGVVSSFEAWDRYQITPGMLYEHTPALAFDMGTVVLATPANLDWLKSQGKQPQKERVIPPNTDLMPLIRRKAKSGIEPYPFTGMPDGCVMDIFRDPKTLEPYVRLEIYSIEEGFFRNKSYMTVLELDRFGRKRGSDEPFRPIVKVKSPSKMEYVIEITGLFGVDPSALQDDTGYYASIKNNGPSYAIFSRDLNRVPYLIVKGDSRRRDSTVKCSLSPRSMKGYDLAEPAPLPCKECTPQNNSDTVKQVQELMKVVK